MNRKEKAKVKELLMEQLQLLHEQAKGQPVFVEELCQITDAMEKLSELISTI